jgi:hypothetical protein
VKAWRERERLLSFQFDFKVFVTKELGGVCFEIRSYIRAVYGESLEIASNLKLDIHIWGLNGHQQAIDER